MTNQNALAKTLPNLKVSKTIRKKVLLFYNAGCGYEQSNYKLGNRSERNHYLSLKGNKVNKSLFGCGGGQGVNVLTF